jgi:hypothetical protein
MPGINQFAVNRNVEHASRAFDELGFYTQCALYFGRQTGGLRQIVSGCAVSDGNLHDLFQRDCECRLIGGAKQSLIRDNFLDPTLR